MERRSSLALVVLTVCMSAQAQESGPGETITFPARDEIQLAPVTEQALDRTGQGVTQRALPGGIVQADHGGTFQNVTLARRTTDGSIETLCTDNRDEALDFLAGLDRHGTAGRQQRQLRAETP